MASPESLMSEPKNFFGCVMNCRSFQSGIGPETKPQRLSALFLKLLNAMPPGVLLPHTETPCRPAPGGEALPVQFVRNLPSSPSRCLQFPDAGQAALLCRLRPLGTIRPRGSFPCALTVRRLWYTAIARRVAATGINGPLNRRLGRNRQARLIPGIGFD